MDEYSIMYTYVDDSFRFSALLRVYDFLIVRSGVTITSLSLFSSPFAERFCVYVFHFSFNIFNIVLSFEFRVSTVTRVSIFNIVFSFEFRVSRVSTDFDIQEQFFHDIQNMITTLHVKPFHLFDETFQFLSMLKEMLHTFLYIFYKEERRKLRREWIQKQHGHENFYLNWCCACH
jgi:hypothetical protein